MPTSLVYVLVTCTALFWGLSFHVGKLILGSMGPLTAVALRFVIASLALLPVTLLRQRHFWAQLRAHAPAFLFLGIVGVSGFNVLLFFGLQFTSPVNGAMIMSTNPLLVLVMARLLLGERMGLEQQVGGILCLLGVLTVITGGELQALTELRANPGDVLILAANGCWALYTVLVRRWLTAVPPLLITTATVLVSALFVGLVALWEVPRVSLAALPAAAWGGLTFLGIAGSALAYLFWNLGIQVLGAPRTSIFFNLVPLFTTLCSMLLGESLRPSQLVGGAVAIVGVLLSSRSPHQPQVMPAVSSCAVLDLPGAGRPK